MNRRAFLQAGAAATISTRAVAGPNKPVPPKPWGAVPNRRQLAWHRLEMYAFVHFTVNTFTGKEWGYGDESPSIFNPTAFDANQIVAAAKSAGLRGIVLTAKHHDGFCLWPSPLTEHSIRNSPYKNGKGDIVREFADACARAGVAFGVYLSPWDRNHADYGRPSYVAYYHAQLRELCSNYGRLFELWFDLANGGDGFYGGAREKRRIDGESYYDWPTVYRIRDELQPMACTFQPKGSDIRWIGTERGVAGDPCWPTMPNRPYTSALGLSGERGAPLWWPAETNTSIRPGWFYHADEDGDVKTPRDLVDLYDHSVARGTNLILNLTPDRRGLIPDPDKESLRAFGDAHRATFACDLAQGALARASAERGAGFEAARVLDGDRATYWSTADGDLTPTLTLDLPPARQFDLIRLREALDLGVRVTRFAIDVPEGGGWREIASHDGIGAQRVIRLGQPIAPRRLRLRIIEATACPAITEFSLFRGVAPAAIPSLRSSTDETVSPKLWRVQKASAPGAESLFGSAGGSWRSPSPASVAIDLGQPEVCRGFVLTPLDVDPPRAGPPARYIVELSWNGTDWEPVADGELSNIVNARQPQRILFPRQRGRFIRFSFPASANDAPDVAVRRLALLTKTR